MATNSVIPWEGDPDENVTAEIGDYLLKVENIGRYVWWHVFYKKEPLTSLDKKPIAPTMRGGMLRCLYAMKRHRKLLN